MSIIVSQHIEGYHTVDLDVPEKTWVKILAGKMLCNDLTVLSIAIERGLLELMSIFGRPEKPEILIDPNKK